MQTESIESVISKIKSGKRFETMAEDGSFYLKIEEYLPFVCTAIHDGHNLRPSLADICALDENERWKEEDPFTGNFIRSMPVVLIGNDSRYEYDLNRPPESCIYNEAWGKIVWKSPLPRDEINLSLQKHDSFYRVLDALLSKLEEKFRNFVVYDIHSYNYRRWDREVPVFNIGTEKLDRKGHGKYINHWLKELSSCELNGIHVSVAENDVFFGRGYLLDHVVKEHEGALVLATEVKKVYCDEDSGEVFPRVVADLEVGLKKAILNNAYFFAKNRTNLKIVKKTKLLSRDLDPVILKIDRQLYDLVKSFEILNYVNPVNLEQEKKKFYASR